MLNRTQLLHFLVSIAAIFFGTSATAQTLSGGATQLHEGGFLATASGSLSSSDGAVQLIRGTLGELGAGLSTGTGVQLRGGVLHVVSDTDGDGVLDAIDNCPGQVNTDQANTDGDAEGNACDGDDDNDGILDTVDAFPLDAAAHTDTDGDGQPDSLTGPSSSGLVEDTDDDGDGLSDGNDQDPLNAANCRVRNSRLVLAWRDSGRLEAPFGLDVSLDPLGRPYYQKNAAARFPLRTGPDAATQEDIRSRVDAIFQSAGNGLPVAPGSFSVETLALGAPVPQQGPGSPVVVYLVDRAGLDQDLDGDGLDDFGELGGVAWSGIDRFNQACDGGYAAVFVKSGETPAEIAEKIAHEAGHLYGLRHIFAGSDFASFKAAACDATGNFTPNPDAIMDYAFGKSSVPSFQSCGSGGCAVVEPPDCRGEDTGKRHNPRYHFLRHVVGYDPGALAGFGPPSPWDDEANPGSVRLLLVQFSFAQTGISAGSIFLSEIKIYAQESHDSPEILIWPVTPEDEALANCLTATGAEAPCPSLAKLAEIRIVIPETSSLKLIAKKEPSAPDARPNTLLAQVPKEWTAANSSLDEVSSSVPVPDPTLPPGGAALETRLITVNSAATEALTLQAQSEPLYRVTDQGLVCDIQAPGNCGKNESGSEIAEGVVVIPRRSSTSRMPEPFGFLPAPGSSLPAPEPGSSALWISGLWLLHRLERRRRRFR